MWAIDWPVVQQIYVYNYQCDAPSYFLHCHHSSIVDERVAVLEFSMLCTSQTVFFSSMFPKPNLNINDVCSCIFTPALPAKNDPHCKSNIPTQRHLPILSCKNMVLPTWFTLEKCCVLIVQSNLLKCFWNSLYKVIF